MVVIGYYTAFIACCRLEEDKCTDYYPYSNFTGFVALFIVSLVFSALITLYLISIITQVLWSYFRVYFQNYIELLS